MLREEIYFAPGYDSIQDVVAEHGELLDATSLSKVAGCPRYHEIRLEQGLRRPEVSAKMVAGIAVHEGLDYYYAIPEPRGQVYEENAIEIMAAEWNSWGIDPALTDAPHLTERNLRTVMKNYFRIWNRERIEVYKPISGLEISDLDLTDVLAAKFKVVDATDTVVMGESSLVMRFEVDGEPLILSGKPDLPVRKKNGRVYVMDHKTTSGYLSDWFFQTHEVSNKLRGYQAMVEKLLGIKTSGAVINGIYVGQYATNPDSKAAKVSRKTFNFTSQHVQEALRNQLTWRKTIDFYRDLDYFPQACGFGGCSEPGLCRVSPEERELKAQQDYEQDPRNFWDL